MLWLPAETVLASFSVVINIPQNTGVSCNWWCTCAPLCNVVTAGWNCSCFLSSCNKYTPWPGVILCGWLGSKHQLTNSRTLGLAVTGDVHVYLFAMLWLLAETVLASSSAVINIPQNTGVSCNWWCTCAPLCNVVTAKQWKSSVTVSAAMLAAAVAWTLDHFISLHTREQNDKHSKQTSNSSSEKNTDTDCSVSKHYAPLL